MHFMPLKPSNWLSVCLFDSQGTGVGALDFFDQEDGDTTANSRVTLEMVEKWWCIGDSRNRGDIWVQGAKLDSSAL